MHCTNVSDSGRPSPRANDIPFFLLNVGLTRIRVPTATPEDDRGEKAELRRYALLVGFMDLFYAKPSPKGHALQSTRTGVSQITPVSSPNTSTTWTVAHLPDHVDHATSTSYSCFTIT